MINVLNRHAGSGGDWRRLDELLRELDSGAPLDRGGADELYRLYRRAASDLAYMQTNTGNPALLDSLEDLVARAHARLAPKRAARPSAAVFRALRHDFPALVRRESRLLAFTVAVFIAGAAFAAVLSLATPTTAETFLSAFPHLLEQSPAEDAAQRMGDSIGFADYTAFSLDLFTHNLRVALLALALGLTFGVGTASVLFLNGAIIGSVAALYARDGVFSFFLSWVGPHGSLELPAIILAGMTGFMLARAQLAGGGSMWQKIAARRKDFLTAVAGIAFLLLLAALIEGGFSQTHRPGIVTLKIAVAAACFCGLIFWLFFLPVQD